MPRYAVVVRALMPCARYRRKSRAPAPVTSPTRRGELPSIRLGIVKNRTIPRARKSPTRAPKPRQRATAMTTTRYATNSHSIGEPRTKSAKSRFPSSSFEREYVIPDGRRHVQFLLHDQGADVRVLAAVDHGRHGPVGVGRANHHRVLPGVPLERRRDGAEEGEVLRPHEQRADGRENNGHPNEDRHDDDGARRRLGRLRRDVPVSV